MKHDADATLPELSCFMGPPESADALYHSVLDELLGCRRLLDLGSGRGRFLELAKARGFEVVGVDRDPRLAAESTRRGIEMVEADIMEYVGTCPEADAVTAVHVIEHFAPGDAMRLLRRAARCLTPGGRLALVTPNFSDVSVAREVFWLDPTHVRPYPPALLQELLSESGLQLVKVVTTGGVRIGRRARLALPFERLRHGRQFGRPNTVAVAERPLVS